MAWLRAGVCGSSIVTAQLGNGAGAILLPLALASGTQILPVGHFGSRGRWGGPVTVGAGGGGTTGSQKATVAATGGGSLAVADGMLDSTSATDTVAVGSGATTGADPVAVGAVTSGSAAEQAETTEPEMPSAAR